MGVLSANDEKCSELTSYEWISIGFDSLWTSNSNAGLQSARGFESHTPAYYHLAWCRGYAALKPFKEPNWVYGHIWVVWIDN